MLVAVANDQATFFSSDPSVLQSTETWKAAFGNRKKRVAIDAYFTA